MAARDDFQRRATGLSHRRTAGVCSYTLVSLAVGLMHSQVVSAQGTVQFNMRFSGTSHIYAPLPSDPAASIIGQGADDAVPSGTTSYVGRAVIGATLTGQFGAQATLASILAGPPGSPESGLIPAQLGTSIGGGTATTFRTGTAAGANAAALAWPNNTYPDEASATFEVVAWDNSSGQYSTWAQASPAWQAGSIAAGKSGIFTIRNLGGSVNSPPPLFPYGGDTNNQMQSFNLYYQWTPPSIVAQPTNTTVLVGSNATFSVAAAGTPDPAYQWRLNGTSIVGATDATLILTNVQLSATGAYSVVVSNAYRTTNSASAQLDVRSILALGNGQVLLGTSYVFVGSVSIELASGFQNGSVFFTLDGSGPSFAASSYSGPFTLGHTATLRAIGYNADFTQSAQVPPISIVIIPTYSLTALAPGGGNVSPAGSIYASNTAVAVTATASNGWTFLNWLGDASGSNPTTNVVMNRNKLVQAVFGTTLSKTVTGNGSVSVYPAAALYPYGTVVRLTATAQPGSYFAVWGNGASGNVNPLYFNVTNPNPTVSSLFASLSGGQVALTAAPNGFGRVTANPRSNSYSPGSSVTLTATPDSGQSFLGWSGDASGTSDPLLITMDQSKVITGVFTRRPALTATTILDGPSADGFRFSLNGEFGAQYRIDGSTNLMDWSPLVVLTNTSGRSQFTDPAGTSTPYRFYRAVLLP